MFFLYKNVLLHCYFRAKFGKWISTYQNAIHVDIKIKMHSDYSIDKNILSRITDNILSRVAEFNDPGITITNLSWFENVKTVSSKAHSMMEMIKRYVGFSHPLDVKHQFYLAQVRSFLQYCSPMWNSSHVKDIIKLERVQRQTSNFILNDYVPLYHERCVDL